ncbi:hypothetical protein NDU88_003547 [Pleurodeles waltl]|uniref:Uncharacterized protein n=1 Tax=Pleurodeles waltl TaxID=8319 RepID=A0AAV7W5E4_PLEWA|nr:hypothetical protein NDU88_003547 [Pleurodeles waltl]
MLGGGGTDTPLQYLRCTLCAARTDAQSWASGLATAKEQRAAEEKGRRGPRDPQHGPQLLPRPDQETPRPASA